MQLQLSVQPPHSDGEINRNITRLEKIMKVRQKKTPKENKWEGAKGAVGENANVQHVDSDVDTPINLEVDRCGLHKTR